MWNYEDIKNTDSCLQQQIARKTHFRGLGSLLGIKLTVIDTIWHQKSQADPSGNDSRKW